MISVIACLDKKNGIGLNGDIPWSLSPDMKHFRKLTSGSVIIMGRRTWESIGSKPLPKRINIVLTSSSANMKGAITYSSLKQAISEAQMYSVPIFIIGGSNVYKDALPFASKVYLTRIDHDYGCDVFFPIEGMQGFDCDVNNWLIHKDITYRFETYSK